MRNVRNIRPGEKVGQLTVLRRGRKTKEGTQLFVLACACGSTFVMSRREVIKKESTACRTCQLAEVVAARKKRPVERGFWTGI